MVRRAIWWSFGGSKLTFIFLIECDAGFSNIFYLSGWIWV
jgi:hypothetical protein